MAVLSWDHREHLFSMNDIIRELFRTDFMPHGHCYFWNPLIVWIHVLSDVVIAGAYFSIPVFLFYFIRKRRDLPFQSIFLMFGFFIVACGMTHLMEIWNVWHGDYALAGIIKGITATVSAATSIALFRITPKALLMPSQSQLNAINQKLQVQIQENERAKDELRRAHEELEKRVAIRTQELEIANKKLQKVIFDHERAEERFRLAVEASPSSMIMINESGKIELVNAQAEETFGYSRTEMLGMQVETLIPSRYRSNHPSHRESFKKNPEARRMGVGRDLFAQRKNGTEFPVEIGLNPIVIQGHQYVLSVIVDITERKEHESRLRLSLEEKEVLLKEIHHRVKNNFQIISSMLRLQSRYVKDPDMLRIYKQSQDRIQSMALIHEMLYKSNNLSKIRFDEYIRELVRMHRRSQGKATDSFTIEIDADPTTLPVQTAMTLGMILNEFVTNAIKHAFPEHRKGRIWIEWKDNRPGKCSLRVRDNGIGWIPGFDWSKSESMGCRLIRILADQLQAELETQTDPGVSWIVTISEPNITTEL